MPNKLKLFRQGWKHAARPLFYKVLALSFILFGAWSLDMHLTDAWKIVLTTISAGVITFLSDILRQWSISEPMTIKKFDKNDEQADLLDDNDISYVNGHQKTIVQSFQHGLFTFTARSVVTAAIGARMVSAQYVRDRHTQNADWWTEGTFFGYITLVLFVSSLINIMPFAIDKVTKKFTRRRVDYVDNSKQHDISGYIRFIWETGQFGLLLSAIIYAQTYKFDHKGRYAFYKDSDALHLLKYLTAGFSIGAFTSLFIGLPILLIKQIPAHAVELFTETDIHIRRRSRSRSRYLFIWARLIEFVPKTFTSAVIGDAILAVTTAYANIAAANSGERPSEYIEDLLRNALLFTAIIAPWTHQHIYYLDYDIKKVPQEGDNQAATLTASDKRLQQVTFGSTTTYIINNTSIPDINKLNSRATQIKEATDNHNGNTLLAHANAFANEIADDLKKDNEADIQYNLIGNRISAFAYKINNRLPEYSLLKANAKKLKGQGQDDNDQEDPKALVGTVLNAVSDLVNASLLNAQAHRLIADIGTPSQNDSNQQLLLAAKSVAQAVADLFAQSKSTSSASTSSQPPKQLLENAVGAFAQHTSGNATQELNNHKQTLQNNNDKATLIKTSQTILDLVKATAALNPSKNIIVSEKIRTSIQQKILNIKNQLNDTNDEDSSIRQTLQECIDRLSNSLNLTTYGEVKTKVQTALAKFKSDVTDQTELGKAIQAFLNTNLEANKDSEVTKIKDSTLNASQVSELLPEFEKVAHTANSTLD